MKVEIYIWQNASDYSVRSWRHQSKLRIHEHDDGPFNQIIINHLLKEYRKNFKCTKHELTSLIKKAKTMLGGSTKEFKI